MSYLYPMVKSGIPVSKNIKIAWSGMIQPTTKKIVKYAGKSLKVF